LHLGVRNRGAICILEVNGYKTLGVRLDGATDLDVVQ
jgi:hypothetical protein